MDVLLQGLAPYGLLGVLCGLFLLMYQAKDKVVSEIQEKRVADAISTTKALESSANAMENHSEVLRSVVSAIDALKIQVEMLTRQRQR